MLGTLEEMLTSGKKVKEGGENVTYARFRDRFIECVDSSNWLRSYKNFIKMPKKYGKNLLYDFSIEISD